MLDDIDGLADGDSMKDSGPSCTGGYTMVMEVTLLSLGAQVAASSSASSRIVAEELVLATPESRFHSSRGDVRGERGEDESDGTGDGDGEEDGDDLKAGCSSVGGATTVPGGAITIGRCEERWEVYEELDDEGGRLARTGFLVPTWMGGSA